MNRIKIIFPAIILLFLAYYNYGYSQTNNLKWRFDKVGYDEFGQPTTNLYLVINEKEYFIEKQDLEFNEEITSSDNNQLIEGQPVILYCFGFWAGYEKAYYVIKNIKNNSYSIYYNESTDADEDSEIGPILFLKDIE